MRIATSTISDNIISQIQQLGTQQARLQTQVATDQRITQPEDDPAAMGRVLHLETEQRQSGQYLRNSDRAMQVSQASFNGLTQIKKISDRMAEIGTLGTGAINLASFQAYASEVNQMIEQALQQANTRFGSDYIFAGTAVATPPSVATRNAQGQVTSLAYAGNLNQSTIALSDTASVAPGTSGGTNTSLNTFLNQLVALRDALAAGSPTAVTTVQTGLITSEDMLVSALAEHGGIQMRIEINQADQATRGTDLEKLVSDEVDADLPTTIVKLNQTQLAYQAALQSSALIMKTTLLDFLR